MDRLESLKGLYKSLDQEDAMVHALQNHCIFGLNPRALDRHLPAWLCALPACGPCAFGCGDRDRRLGGFRGSRRKSSARRWATSLAAPALTLGIKLGEMAKNNPQFVGVVLGGHGLFTWGKTAKECYDTTLRIINKAAVWLEMKREKPAFRGAKVEALADAERAAVALRLPLPEIRGRISKHERKIGHFVDSPEVLEFVNSNMLEQLAPSAPPAPITSCAPRSAR